MIDFRTLNFGLNCIIVSNTGLIGKDSDCNPSDTTVKSWNLVKKDHLNKTETKKFGTLTPPQMFLSVESTTTKYHNQSLHLNAEDSVNSSPMDSNVDTLVR